MPSAQTLTSLLAGTQCAQCGYPSCAAYAQALETGQETHPGLCRPGGPRVAQAVALALDLPPQPPAQPPAPPHIAVVEESDCIGCTLCLQACPTSAIVGAAKQLHTVLPGMCTGCGLCLPPCPVACVTLTPAPAGHSLTAQKPDGSLTPAAQAATWKLVDARTARAKTGGKRATGNAKTTHQPFRPTALAPELAAKIAAARAKSAAIYAAKGPLRVPAALKKGKGGI